MPAPAATPARRRSIWLISQAVLVLSATLGCSDDAVLGDATVELGTGTVDFEPMMDGQEQILVAGPQGGFHFIVHARATGIVPGDPTMPGIPKNPHTSFSAFLDGDRIDLGLAPYRLGYEDAGDGTLVLPSGRILQIDEARVQDVYHHSIRIVVEVEDKDGDRASDERTVTAIPDPNGPDAETPP